MNMQPLSSSNLKYRVNSIMKYSGPTNTRRWKQLKYGYVDYLIGVS
jgi:hypothetical protein